MNEEEFTKRLIETLTEDYPDQLDLPFPSREESYIGLQKRPIQIDFLAHSSAVDD